MKKRSLGKIAAAAVATLMLTSTAACSSDSGENDGPAKVKDTLIVVQQTDVASLNTNIASQRTSSRVAGEIVESAVKIEFDGDEAVMAPGLAESWEQIDDHTWRFKVRPGVAFTNGEKLTANNWKTSLAQMRENPAGKHAVLRNLEVEVIDELTFDIVTTEPNLGSLPVEMTWFPVMPTEYRDSVSEADFGDAPIGTGPYMLDSWQKGLSLDLKANPDYWGKQPAIKKITILTVSDAATRVGMLETGTADLIDSVPTELASRVEAIDGATLKWGNGDTRSMLVLNTNTPPTDNLKVRQAINHAIDKESLVDSLFGGHAKAIYGIAVEGELGYDPNFKGYRYDPEKAKSLLAEAGYPSGGVEIDLNYTIGTSVQDQKVAEALQAMLEKVGFTVNMKGGEFATVQPTWRKPGASSGMYTMTFGPVYPDMSFLFNAYFDPQAVYGPIWTKEVPELTELSWIARTTSDPAERQKLYEKAQQIVMDEALWAPMFQFQNGYGMVESLNWAPTPDNRFYFENASFK